VNKSAKQFTEDWIDTASKGQLQNMIQYLIDNSMEAALLADQFTRNDA